MNCPKCNNKMKLTFYDGHTNTFTCSKCNHYVEELVEKEKPEKKIEITLSYTQEELQDLKKVLWYSRNLWLNSNENNLNVLDDLISVIEIQEAEERYE